jgi:hypothetical protein
MCTAQHHVWSWSGSGSALAAPPALRCLCGRLAVRDIDPIQAAAAAVAERDAARREVEDLRAALSDLITFAEDAVEEGYRPADVPTMLAWPPLEQARRVLGV